VLSYHWFARFSAGLSLVDLPLSQVNLTLEAWDRGEPERNSIATLSLKIHGSSMESEVGPSDPIKLEIDETTPAGNGQG